VNFVLQLQEIPFHIGYFGIQKSLTALAPISVLPALKVVPSTGFIFRDRLSGKIGIENFLHFIFLPSLDMLPIMRNRSILIFSVSISVIGLDLKGAITGTTFTGMIDRCNRSNFIQSVGVIGLFFWSVVKLLEI